MNHVEITEQNIVTVVDQFSQTTVSNAINSVKRIVDEFEHDLSTGTSRQRTISAAAKIATFKTKCDEQRKSLVRPLKEQAKIIDMLGKELKNGLDELQIEMRQPVTVWEQSEQRRIDEIKDRIFALGGATYVIGEQSDATLDEIRGHLSALKEVVIDESFCEFKEQAQTVLNSSIMELAAHIEAEEKWAAQEAKIAALKEEKRLAQAHDLLEIKKQQDATKKLSALLADAQRKEREATEKVERLEQEHADRERAEEAEKLRVVRVEQEAVQNAVDARVAKEEAEKQAAIDIEEEEREAWLLKVGQQLQQDNMIKHKVDVRITASRAIAEIFTEGSCEICLNTTDKIVEAIEAGKIPGVSLTF